MNMLYIISCMAVSYMRILADGLLQIQARNRIFKSGVFETWDNNV